MYQKFSILEKLLGVIHRLRKTISQNNNSPPPANNANPNQFHGKIHGM